MPGVNLGRVSNAAQAIGNVRGDPCNTVPSIAAPSVDIASGMTLLPRFGKGVQPKLPSGKTS